MIKKYLDDKAIGFYVALAVAVLGFITALMYVGIFPAIDKEVAVSWGAFTFLLLGFILGAACLVLPMFVPSLKGWLLPAAPFIIGAAAFIALCLYMPTAYNYVSKNNIGTTRLDPAFFVSAAFFLITALAGTAGIFIKVIKKDKTEAKA
ncbi:MAG: hypothetical protein FWD58_00055 [Firmicutes bacterium]|nr:hypothetical protein [Bacillota bacterium]